MNISCDATKNKIKESKNAGHEPAFYLPKIIKSLTKIILSSFAVSCDQRKYDF